MHNKNVWWRWILLAFCLFLSVQPVFARPVLLETNKVEVVLGTPAEKTDGAIFKDGDVEIWKRDITSGKIDPGDAFTVANDTASGTFYLTLTAPDTNCPNGDSKLVKRDRTKTLSQSYANTGDPVFFPVDVSILPTILDTPPPVTGIATQTGFSLELKPAIYVDLKITGQSPFTGNYAGSYYLSAAGYHYEVYAGATMIESANVASGQFFLTGDYSGPAKEYTLKAYAYNGYTNQPSGYGDTCLPRWSGEIKFTTVPAGAVPGAQAATFLLTFESGADAGNTGINFFSMPIPPDAGGNWYASKNQTNKTISNAYELILAINEAAAPNSNVVSTFGKWDGKAQTVGGKLIAYPIPDATSNELKKIKFLPGEGYQVYVNKKVELFLSNEAPK